MPVVNFGWFSSITGQYTPFAKGEAIAYSEMFMTEGRKMTYVALAAFLWSFVGLLAGTVLGLALGLSGRPVVFLAAIGMAVGWFGFSGSRISIASLDAKPEEDRNSLPDDVGQKRLRPEEARRWLDDFLVKQQRK